MRINTNISALNTHRRLTTANEGLARSIGRLSSGLRINKASDDAAGLGIANKLRADVRSLRQAANNAEQGNSMLQVMEGATAQISGILERMKELATQANSASSGADSGTAKTQLQAEFSTLISELDRIVSTTTFNGQTLLAGGFGTSVDDATSTYDAAGTGLQTVSLNGTAADTYTFANAAGSTTSVTLSNSGGTSQTVTAAAGRQTLNFSSFGISVETTADFDIDSGTGGSSDGATIVVTGTASGSFMVSSSGSYDNNDLVSIDAIDVDSTTLGVNGDDISTASGAQTALTNLDTAIDTLADAIGDIGAAQGRINYALANVRTTVENTAAAESTIRDVDMAAEVTTMTKFQILQQAATSVLAQANSTPQTVLSLLR